MENLFKLEIAELENLLETKEATLSFVEMAGVKSLNKKCAQKFMGLQNEIATIKEILNLKKENLRLSKYNLKLKRRLKNQKKYSNLLQGKINFLHTLYIGDTADRDVGFFYMRDSEFVDALYLIKKYKLNKKKWLYTNGEVLAKILNYYFKNGIADPESTLDYFDDNVAIWVAVYSDIGEIIADIVGHFVVQLESGELDLENKHLDFLVDEKTEKEMAA